MAWVFRSAESVLPDLVSEEDQNERDIEETPFDGCAWCGTGEGCCDMHMASMLVQSAELKASRQGGM